MSWAMTFDELVALPMPERLQLAAVLALSVAREANAEYVTTTGESATGAPVYCLGFANGGDAAALLVEAMDELQGDGGDGADYEPVEDGDD